MLGVLRGVGGGSGRSLGKTAKISAPAGLSTGLLCAADGQAPCTVLLLPSSLVPAETIHVRHQQGTGFQRRPLQPQNSHPNQGCRHPA